jgi:hypothetical protein
MGTNAHGRVVIVRELADGVGTVYRYIMARETGSRIPITRAMASRILRDGGAQRFTPAFPIGGD